MLRMSRLTDYGTVVLAYIARGPDAIHTASEVADSTRLSQTTVSKLLKALTRAGLLESFRGAAGGYRLARPATDISAAQIIDALEGPVSITECSVGDSQCELATVCGVGSAWQHINVAIRRALDGISLAQLLGPASALPPVMELERTVPNSKHLQ